MCHFLGRKQEIENSLRVSDRGILFTVSSFPACTKTNGCKLLQCIETKKEKRNYKRVENKKKESTKWRTKGKKKKLGYRKPVGHSENWTRDLSHPKRESYH